MSLAKVGRSSNCVRSFLSFKGSSMRTLFSVIALFSVALPALARDNPLPEPGSIALLGVGAVGLLLALRKK